MMHPIPNKEDNRKYHFSTKTRTYLRGISDDVIRSLDLIETYIETCGTLETFYSSAQYHRQNQIMYILTVVSTIFL